MLTTLDGVNVLNGRITIRSCMASHSYPPWQGDGSVHFVNTILCAHIVRVLKVTDTCVQVCNRAGPYVEGNYL